VRMKKPRLWPGFVLTCLFDSTPYFANCIIPA